MKVKIYNNVSISLETGLQPNDDFIENKESYQLGLSGIVLNCDSMKPEELQQALVSGTTQRKYHGSYVVWYYDRQNEKIYIANDLLSKQSVYYYSKDCLILVNTSFFDLCKDLRDNGRIPQIDLEAVDFFCNTRVFRGEMTYERDTKYLPAYAYIIIDCKKKELHVKKLPIPKMKSLSEISEDDVIDELERRFSAACDMQWLKNDRYGKDQVLTLSGGMDSRAVFLHMKNQDSFSRIKTYTYAQTGSNDAEISRKLAEREKVCNTFLPLDQCEFVYRRDEIITANEGQMYYIGSTGAIQMADKCIKKDHPGIVHTGLGGGEIMGDICKVDGDKLMSPNASMTENQRINLDDIRCCLNLAKTTSRHFTAFSPFLDEDFFEYAMCLPAAIRRHRKIYIKWYRCHMNGDFPSALNYSIALKVLKRIKARVFKKLGKKNPASMNPVDYWFATQPKLKSFVEETWQKDCERLNEQKMLLHHLKPFFSQDIVRKFSVLTVTGSVIKMLGLDSTADFMV